MGGVTITPHPRPPGGGLVPGFAWGPGCALERAKPSGPPGYHCASPLLTRLPTSAEGPQTTGRGPPPAMRGWAQQRQRRRGSAPARQHGRCLTGTGISTRHPSTTPVGLALGPDSPREDEPAPGTLGLSAPGTLTPVSLLMPAFSLPRGPPTGHPRASPRAGRSPTTRTRVCGSAASAARLSPAELSAHDHSTSELLRTLSRVAASKPTSWLSARPHILSHLARA